MSQYIETEIKLYVVDHAPTVARLETLGAALTAPRVLERNTRYDTAGEALRAKRAVLRLRSDTRARLTYKDGDRLTGDYGVSRFEAEVEVSDFDTMEVILRKLGFASVLEYEKYRTTYQLYGVEVTLDEMPYGNFVEIEGEDAAIGRVMSALELSTAVRMTNSYVVLFETVRRNLELKFKD